MAYKFERALLLCPEKYSLYHSLLETLSFVSQEVKGYNIKSAINHAELQINTQIYRFPYNFRKKWEKYFLKKVNQILLKTIISFDPDLVLVYNSEYLLPETCAEIKKKSKLIFFMGDSPFYTPQNNYYLSCLTYADLILSPDSFWSQQLNTLGLNKTLYFIPGLDGRSYFKITGFSNNFHFDDSEILYVGACYLNSWGYKKALLMSKLTCFDFKLYGNSAWKRWFRFFPDLQTVYRESSYIPTEQLNIMFNKTKLIPVDGNPAILNGFHLRLFEALGSGALPLVENREDIRKILFKECNTEVPVIKDYNKASDLAHYYLKNEKERQEIANNLKEFILTKYNAETNAGRLLEGLRNKD